MKKCDKTALLLFNVLALKNIGTNFIFIARLLLPLQQV
jgi:hypothetical protein